MQSGKKELLTATASTLLADALRRHGQLRLRAHGCSMFPAIRSGDILSIQHCTKEYVRSGDIVLVAEGERLFAHRLIEKQLRNGESFLITRGDAHWRADPARPASTLLGHVVAVTRNGRLLHAPLATTLGGRVYGVVASELTRLTRRIRRRLPGRTVERRWDGERL